MPDIDKTDKPVAPNRAQGALPLPPVAAPPAEPAEPTFDAEEYERLLDMYDVSFRNFAEGEVVAGRSCCGSPSPRSSSTWATSPRA